MALNIIIWLYITYIAGESVETAIHLMDYRLDGVLEQIIWQWECSGHCNGGGGGFVPTPFLRPWLRHWSNDGWTAPQFNGYVLIWVGKNCCQVWTAVIRNWMRLAKECWGADREVCSPLSITGLWWSMTICRWHLHTRNGMITLGQNAGKTDFGVLHTETETGRALLLAQAVWAEAYSLQWVAVSGSDWITVILDEISFYGESM